MCGCTCLRWQKGLGQKIRVADSPAVAGTHAVCEGRAAPVAANHLRADTVLTGPTLLGVLLQGRATQQGRMPCF